MRYQLPDIAKAQRDVIFLYLDFYIVTQIPQVKDGEKEVAQHMASLLKELNFPDELSGRVLEAMYQSATTKKLKDAIAEAMGCLGEPDNDIAVTEYPQVFTQAYQ